MTPAMPINWATWPHNGDPQHDAAVDQALARCSTYRERTEVERAILIGDVLIALLTPRPPRSPRHRWWRRKGGGPAMSELTDAQAATLLLDERSWLIASLKKRLSVRATDQGFGMGDADVCYERIDAYGHVVGRVSVTIKVEAIE